jgi:hypothetical protein
MYKFSVEGELSLLEGRWKNVVGDTILDSSLRVCSMKFVMNLTANIMAIYRLRWRTTSACIEGEGRGDGSVRIVQKMFANRRWISISTCRATHSNASAKIINTL